MASMIADGTFERMFFEHFGQSIHALDLTRRRVFRIDNPFVSPVAPPFDGEQLGFDPMSDPVPPAGAALSLVRPPPPLRPLVRRRTPAYRPSCDRVAEGPDGP
jgi:hypothetical protein